MEHHRQEAQTVLCRGVRGATVAQENTREAIFSATRELLAAIIEANGIEPQDVASVFFTLTPDLNAGHPAAAAREMGWTHVPLFCAQEIDVPGGLAQAVRVLIHWNTAKTQDDIVHIYSNGAEVLRPDLIEEQKRGIQK